MKTRHFLSVLGIASSATIAWSATPAVDVLPAAQRHATVEKATRLAQPPVAGPVAPDLTNPFNPPDFTAPDPEEQRANAAARAAGQPPPSGPAAQAAPLGNRELLETIAARIQPTGSIVGRGKPLLTFSGRTPTVGIGQSFVVTYEGQDYELEVMAIDRTTFTLRYRGEEITRPIKPTR